MTDDFETFIKSQLRTLQAQIEVIKGYLNEYDEKNRKLKKIMSEELIAALILRFERNEERIRKMDEKLDSTLLSMEEKFLQELRSIRNDMSEAKLSKAISCILDDKEIRVDSKPLKELKDYDLE